MDPLIALLPFLDIHIFAPIKPLNIGGSTNWSMYEIRNLLRRISSCSAVLTCAGRAIFLQQLDDLGLVILATLLVSATDCDDPAELMLLTATILPS